MRSVGIVGVLSVGVSVGLWGNLFVMSDKSGTILTQKHLTPTQNRAILQHPTEYSYQAIYDALHKEANLARRASLARQRAKRISQAQANARKQGKAYRLSPKEQQQLLTDAKAFQGGRYVWGGTSPEGFDCSGYVQYLYKQHHIPLPRTALAQSKQGTSVSRTALKKGDLLFFLTDKSRHIPITHVGIYLGDGTFIHAASKQKGIIISPLESGSYAERFVLARRILSPHKR